MDDRDVQILTFLSPRQSAGFDQGHHMDSLLVYNVHTMCIIPVVCYFRDKPEMLILNG